jgi:hypothetical protein
MRPLLATHVHAFDAIPQLPQPLLAMFIGSSIGNYEDSEALELLGGLSQALDRRSWLLLGTDLRKSPGRLLAAYDDSAGVTAAFNKNVLTRINRELGGRFSLHRSWPLRTRPRQSGQGSSTSRASSDRLIAAITLSQHGCHAHLFALRMNRMPDGDSERTLPVVSRIMFAPCENVCVPLAQEDTEK